MIDFKAQNLINLVSNLSKSDLDKAFVFNESKGEFGVDRNTKIGPKPLLEREFVNADQTLTQKGMDNVVARNLLFNALCGWIDTDKAKETELAFIRQMAVDLLGDEGLNRGFSVDTASKPLAMREVKQMVATATVLFALTTAFEDKDILPLLKNTDELKQRGALNGKQSAVNKSVEAFYTKLHDLTTGFINDISGSDMDETKRNSVKDDFTRKVISAKNEFDRSAGRMFKDLKGVKDAVDTVLGEHRKNGGVEFGPRARDMFEREARSLYKAGMNYKAFTQAVRGALPRFLEANTPAPSVLVDGQGHVRDNIDTRSMGLSFNDIMVAQDKMQKGLADEKKLITRGMKLTATPRFELKGSSFAGDLFLGGGLKISDTYDGAMQRFFDDNQNRGMHVKMSIAGKSVDFGPRSFSDEQPLLSGNLLMLCQCRTYQAMGVMKALSQRVESAAWVVANRFAGDNPTRDFLLTGFVNGCDCELSADETGNVLVKLSTKAESSVKSSVTLVVDEGGNCTMKEFSGVSTNPDYADKQEMAARRQEIRNILLPNMQRWADEQQQAAYKFMTPEIARELGPDATRDLKDSLETAKSQLLGQLEDLSHEEARPDKKDFGDYKRIFQARFQESLERFKARVGCGDTLRLSLREPTQKIDEAFSRAIGKFQGNGVALTVLNILADKVSSGIDRIKHDFYLSGESSEKGAGEVQKAVSTFVEDLAAKLDALDPTADADYLATDLGALQDASLPKFTFVTFGAESREAILSRQGLVSTGAVGRLAIEKSQISGSKEMKNEILGLAESMDNFAANVNRLITGAGSWSDEQARDKFVAFAREKTSVLTQSVENALKKGVVPKGGIGGALRDAFDAISGEFRTSERGERVAALKVMLTAAQKTVSGYGTDPKKFNHSKFNDGHLAAMKKVQADLQKKIVALDSSNVVPSRACMLKLEMMLNAKLAKLADNLRGGNAHGVNLKDFWSAFTSKDVKFSEAIKDKAENYDVHMDRLESFSDDPALADNPFDATGFASTDALDRFVRVSTAIRTRLQEIAPNISTKAMVEVENLDGAKEFLIDIDGDGNSRGLTAGNARLFAAELHNAIEREVKNLAEGLHDRDPGQMLDISGAVNEDFVTRVVNGVKAAFASTIDQLRDLKVAENVEASKLRPGEVLVRGKNYLGIDLESLDETQRKHMRSFFVDCCAVDKVKKEYDRLKSVNQSQADAFVDGFLEQVEPVFDGDPATTYFAPRFSADLITGSIPLKDPYERNSLVFASMIVADGSSGYDGACQRGFGTSSMGQALKALKSNGLSEKVLADFLAKPLGDLKPEQKLGKLKELLAGLYEVNGQSTEALNGLCMRVFGRGLLECDLMGITGNGGQITKWVELTGYPGPLNYRAYDPIQRMPKVAMEAVALMMRTGQKPTGNFGEILAIMKALQQLQRNISAHEEIQPVALKYNGQTFTLNSTETGVLTMTMSNLQLGTCAISPDIDHKKETRDVTVLLPLDLTSLVQQFQDDVTRNVSGFGLKEVKDILPQPSSDVSSTSRQKALNVIASMSGRNAVEFSNVTSADLLRIAHMLLDLPVSGKNVEEMRKAAVARLDDELARLDLGNKVLFNSESTLEIYSDLLQATSSDQLAKVEVPAVSKRIPGESVQAARLRQVHAFVSELVMPDDTTKFDLDRRNGKSVTDIMRATLLSHRYEFTLLLNHPDLVETFTFSVAGEGGGHQNASMPEMTNALKLHLTALKSIIDRAGGMTAFYARLEEMEKGAADTIGINDCLKAMSTSVNQASDAILGKMQHQLTEKLQAAFRKSMASTQGKELWQLTLDDIAGSGTLDVDSGYGQFLVEMLATYFTRMEPIDRQRMSSALFRFANSASTSGEMLGALIKGAGPVLQKLMQGLPQTALPEDLRSAVLDLKSNLPSIPLEMVRATLLDMVKQSDGHITKIRLDKALGAATVGETFTCTVYTTDKPDGEECVLKLLRPDVQNRARRERALFMQLAKKNPNMSEALQKRLDSIFDEMVFTIEAENVKQGSIYNSGVVKDDITGIESMKLYPYVGVSANVMMLRKAPGSTYDKIISNAKTRFENQMAGFDKVTLESGTVVYSTGDLGKFIATRNDLQADYKRLLAQQKRLVGFIDKWTYEAIFGNGFFHGDLHSGNIMGDDNRLTVIDYGNAIQLTPDERTNLKWALAWIPARSAERFLSYYENILTPVGRQQLKANYNKLVAALNDVFQRADPAKTGLVMADCFQVIQQHGVELPPSIFCMMQSMQRLDESVRLLNERLQSISDAYHLLQFQDEPAGNDHMPKFLSDIFGGLSDKSQYVDSKRNLPFREILNGILTNYGLNLSPEDGSVNYRQGIGKLVKNALYFNENMPEQTENNPFALFKRQLLGEDKAERTKTVESLTEFRDWVMQFDGTADGMFRTSYESLVNVFTEMPDDLADRPVEERESWFGKFNAASEPFIESLFSSLWSNMIFENEDSVPFQPFEDANAGFGSAISRGGSDFVAEIAGSVKKAISSVFKNSSLTLKDRLKAEAAKALIQEGRIKQLTRAIGHFTDLGLYYREFDIVIKEMDDFRFEYDVPKILQDGKFMKSPANMETLRKSMNFNLQNLFDALRTIVPETRLNDPGFRNSVIRLAMLEVSMTRPEWFTAIGKLTPVERQSLAAGNDDLQRAFDELAAIDRIPNLKKELSEDDKRRLHDQFDLV